MKIVINNDYGGFGMYVTERARQMFQEAGYSGEERTNKDLINFVKNNPDECGYHIVVKIPDEATDWTILEYDGLEEVIYVLNGKIYYAEEDDDTD